MTVPYTRLVWRLSFASAFFTLPALAVDPLNSSNRPEAEKQPSIVAPPDANAADDGEFERNEFNLLPVVGGSTDLGIGGGYFAGLTHVKKGADPYVWNIDSAGLVSFKYTQRSGLKVPYQDLYARLTVPRLFGAPLRLEIRPSYTWESVDYFGMGNASSAALPSGATTDYTKYQRGHPQFDVDVHARIVDHLSLHLGFRYIQDVLTTPANSRLAEDLRSGSAEVKRLIGATGSHAVVLFKYGLQLDTRDNETSPHSGTFDTLDVKLSPGGTDEYPYRYGEALANLRAFVPIWKPHVTLAVRVVGDGMFGHVPFYELARFDDTYAIGGGTGVRGVPAQRYYGKLKLLGNIELRTELFTFHALGKDIQFGLVPFFDGGRVWADWESHPELDGRGLGLKYGWGGGIRLRSGSAFVIRADVAASPDASPVSGYVAAGQAF